MELNLCLPNLNLKIADILTDTAPQNRGTPKAIKFFFGATFHFVILFMLYSSHSVTCSNSGELLLVVMNPIANKGRIHLICSAFCWFKRLSSEAI